MTATIDPKAWSKWFVSDGPQVYSPEPLHSPNGFVLAGPVYDYPADVPFPSASTVPLPVSPRPRKLRKSVVIPASPPKLPPLSFTTDDSPSSSRSVNTSSSRASLLRKNPPTPPTSPTSKRKLVKRRPSLPAIQSGSYAYLTEQPPPVPPLPSSPTSLASAPTPNRSHSDPTQSPTKPDAPIQRTSSLMTIRGFSLRSRKARALVEKDRLSSPSRWGVGMWSGRSSASENGHFTRTEEGKEWLPLMTITPFHVNLPPPSVSPPQLTLSALGPDTAPSSANDSTQHLPWGSESTGSLLASEQPRPPSPLPHKRAKFTLSPDVSAQAPPTPDDDFNSPSSSTSHGSHNLSRPPLVRRDARTWSSRRRWTLAMAMTDEGITDEVLVEELEKMRLRREWSGEDLDEGWDVWDAGCGWATSQSAEGDAGRAWGEDNWIQDSPEGAPRPGYSYARRSSWKGDVYGGPRDNIDPDPDPDEPSPPTASALPSTPSLPHLPGPHPPSAYASRNPRSSTTPTATWTTARRALLTCRELVRTERHYLASLQALIAGDTTSAPPPLMLRYAGGLARASAALLRRMEEDPSAWGVAAAFLAEEEDVEGAFVGWCGVVGEWFEGSGGGDGDVAPKRKGSKVGLEEEGSPLKRGVSTWRRSFPSISSLNVSVGVTPLPPSAFLNRRKEKEKEREPAVLVKRKPPVRDLAILPTQRVMRYVLLYRDLLAHTPATSPSRALVERAVDAACRIAQKCDRAQGNSAFLQRR